MGAASDPACSVVRAPPSAPVVADAALAGSHEPEPMAVAPALATALLAPATSMEPCWHTSDGPIPPPPRGAPPQPDRGSSSTAIWQVPTPCSAGINRKLRVIREEAEPERAAFNVAKVSWNGENR